MDYKEDKDQIFIQDGEKILAKLQFACDDDVYKINKIFVDESFRGQGIAGKLMENFVKKALKENKNIKPICGFAIKWFERHKEYDDFLVWI